MKRNTLIAAIVVTGLVVGAGPAAALSCAPPEPFDMEAGIAAADAAAIGTITSISAGGATDLGGEELVLTIEVSNVFKGTVSSRLTLDRATSIWGPYYEEGQELALLVTDGVVQDGQNSLCGPYFSPAEMRAAGGDPTEPAPQAWSIFQLLRNLLFDLVSVLLGG